MVVQEKISVTISLHCNYSIIAQELKCTVLFYYSFKIMVSKFGEMRDGIFKNK